MAAEIVARGGSGDTVVKEHEPGESGDEGLGRLVASLAAVGGARVPLRRRLQNPSTCPRFPG